MYNILLDVRQWSGKVFFEDIILTYPHGVEIEYIAE